MTMPRITTSDYHLPGEDWKPLTERLEGVLTGAILVSNKGRILNRYTGVIYSSKSRYLTLAGRRYLYAALVASVWLPQADGMFLRFRDGNPLNPAVDNVYWSPEPGPRRRGTKPLSSSPAKAQEMREAGASVKQISQALDVSRATVYRYLSRSGT